MLNVKISGLEQLTKNLRELSNKAQALDGNHSVKLSDMYPPAFLQKNTPFSTVDEMFAKSGFKVSSQDDLQSIPDAEWNAFIVANTKFKSWDEMKNRAGAEWAKRNLGL